jgi:hypothetical protein
MAPELITSQSEEFERFRYGALLASGRVIPVGLPPAMIRVFIVLKIEGSPASISRTSIWGFLAEASPNSEVPRLDESCSSRVWSSVAFFHVHCRSPLRAMSTR